MYSHNFPFQKIDFPNWEGQHPRFTTVTWPYNFQTYRTAWGNISDGYGLISEDTGHFCTAKIMEWRHNNVLTCFSQSATLIYRFTWDLTIFTACFAFLLFYLFASHFFFLFLHKEHKRLRNDYRLTYGNEGANSASIQEISIYFIVCVVGPENSFRLRIVINCNGESDIAGSYGECFRRLCFFVDLIHWWRIFTGDKN